MFAVRAIVSLAAIVVCASVSSATFTITNGNASFTYNTTVTGTGGHGQTTTNFAVNGTDHLFRNSFFARINADTREFGIGSGAGNPWTLSSEVASGNTATLTYTHASATATQTFRVIGGNIAGRGAYQTALTITNTSAASMTLNLFPFYDFDIGGTAGSDSAVIVSGSQTRISEGANLLNVYLSENANAFQITAFNTLATSLNDTSVTTLDNTGSPFGPGDYTGGFQYTRTLAPGESFSFGSTADLNGVAVPAPAALWMSFAGAGALGLLRRRFRAA